MKIGIMVDLKKQPFEFKFMYLLLYVKKDDKLSNENLLINNRLVLC